jgi:hypothetical protein
MRLSNTLAAAMKRLASARWSAEILAVSGGVLYTVLLFVYAHTRQSVLDEGAYLYKGYLFATGQYTPYQPYGPWTNHTPLAFLIPGYVQVLFGPGLRTGRYFAIFIAVLMLPGLWILARRMGNRWWAAGVIWVLAINPMLLKTYSTAVTQGLIACLLIWMLALVLGEKRSLWEIILGSILAGIMVMTRIDMLPVLPLLVLFVFWQHGKKAGIASLLAAGLIFFGIHAIYWPGILQVWTRLPKALTPFLNEWRGAGGQSSWQPDYSTTSRILSLFSTFRAQFTAMFGVLALLLLWPRKNRWNKLADFRDAVFLGLLFIVLFITHIWAALGKDYCVFCLPGYVAFFSEIGLLLIILTFAAWRQKDQPWVQTFIAILVMVLFTGIGFSAFEDLGESLYNFPLPHWLVGSSRNDYAALGAVLVNKFNSLAPASGVDASLLRRILPSLLGVLIGLLVLGIAILSQRVARRKSIASLPSLGYYIVVITLIVGTILTPTTFMSGGASSYDCNGDVIRSYEVAGRYLATVIPPGAHVYWMGGLSVVPLLYVPDIQIYPAQINGDYSFLLSSDSDRIWRLGKWNQELAARWANEADFLLIQERYYEGWLKILAKSDSFTELTPTPPTVPCQQNSQIRIFQRIR